MALEEYRKKRDFQSTPEPGGKDTGGASGRDQGGHGLVFVMQKHQARNLHYDFRLEWNGVLLSWAIPKGPSLDPSVKRLATQVEDHPVEYAQYEGIIPAGEYGGGTVMIWDRGTWTPEVSNVEEALAKGDFKFTLHGQKLAGSWVLVRTRGFPAGSGRTPWLLIKHRDERASEEDITTTRPNSVASGRTLAEIARTEGGDVEKAASGDVPRLTLAARRARSAAAKKATSLPVAVRKTTARPAAPSKSAGLPEAARKTRSSSPRRPKNRP